MLFQNFAPDSLLAACLLQKVMGLGDRHHDNIFLSKRGEIFFASVDHISGNYRSKIGIKREKPAFFVTHQMDLVLEAHELKEIFLKKFERAFLVMRERKHDILTLLFAMRDSGCMELQTTQDISSYMEFALCSGMSDDDAVKMIRDQYVESLQSKTTMMGNFIHILAH